MESTTYNMKTDFYGLEFITCKEQGRLALVLDRDENGVESVIQMNTDQETMKLSMEEAQQNFNSGKWCLLEEVEEVEEIAS